MNLNGKVALVTGGARIGVAVAEKLAEKGADIAVTYRSSRATAEETVALVGKHGVRGISIRCDVTSERSVENLVQRIRRTFGRLDVVVNMASVYVPTRYEKIGEAEWNRDLDANLKSAFLTVKHAAPLLKKRGGRVVNISDWVSASGRPRYRNFLSYFTSKSGVIGLTQAQALELAPSVLVNAIAPGPIVPPKGIRNEEVRDVAKVTPLGRWGGAAEIAKAVIFLCETDFVTGECLRVDGGRHLY